MSTERPITVGDRVSVRGSIPKAYGRPIAEVVSLGPVCARVRLFADGSEWRIPYEDLRLTAGQAWIDEHPERAVDLGLVDTSSMAKDDGSADEDVEEVEAPAGPVVVISCGGAKADRPAPIADLWDADLRGADLRGADLWDANLRDADLLGARADRWTRWPDGFDPKQAGVRS